MAHRFHLLFFLLLTCHQCSFAIKRLPTTHSLAESNWQQKFAKAATSDTERVHFIRFIANRLKMCQAKENEATHLMIACLFFSFLSAIPVSEFGHLNIEISTPLEFSSIIPNEKYNLYVEEWKKLNCEDFQPIAEAAVESNFKLKRVKERQDLLKLSYVLLLKSYYMHQLASKSATMCLHKETDKLLKLICQSIDTSRCFFSFLWTGLTQYGSKSQFSLKDLHNIVFGKDSCTHCDLKDNLHTGNCKLIDLVEKDIHGKKLPEKEILVPKQIAQLVRKYPSFMDIPNIGENGKVHLNSVMQSLRRNIVIRMAQNNPQSEEVKKWVAEYRLPVMLLQPLESIKQMVLLQFLSNELIDLCVVRNKEDKTKDVITSDVSGESSHSPSSSSSSCCSSDDDDTCSLINDDAQVPPPIDTITPEAKPWYKNLKQKIIQTVGLATILGGIVFFTYKSLSDHSKNSSNFSEPSLNFPDGSIKGSTVILALVFICLLIASICAIKLCCSYLKMKSHQQKKKDSFILESNLDSLMTPTTTRQKTIQSDRQRKMSLSKKAQHKSSFPDSQKLSLGDSRRSPSQMKVLPSLIPKSAGGNQLMIPSTKLKIASSLSKLPSSSSSAASSALSSALSNATNLSSKVPSVPSSSTFSSTKATSSFSTLSSAFSNPSSAVSTPPSSAALPGSTHSSTVSSLSSPSSPPSSVVSSTFSKAFHYSKKKRKNL